MGILILL